MTYLPKALRTELHSVFTCPECGKTFRWETTRLVCENNHQAAVVRGVPRFVPDDAYVGSFSFEWNTHNQTQIDTHRGDDSSQQIFREKTHLSPEDLQGKLVLDAGVGAGRFCDVMSSWGASVVGVDLSFAVEASHANFLGRDNVLIAQADIGKLPFRPGTFDHIVSIGVLHHTPDTRRYFEGLVPLLKSGGRITIWVYPGDERSYIARNEWIKFTNKIPEKMFYDWCTWFIHRAVRNFQSRLVQMIYKVFPFSNQGLGIENDILDLFDGYSPKFHGIHTPEEVIMWFESAGLTDVRSLPIHTTVTGIKP